MRLVLFLLVIYLIAAHWLGWWLAFAAVACVLVLLSLLAAWLGRGKTGVGDSTGETEAAVDASTGEAVPELKPAIKSLDEGAFRRCLEQVWPHVDDPRPMARADALRLCALAWSRLEDYAQALPYWERLADIEGTPSAWLNVATSQAMAGEFDRADEAFARMQELHDAEHGAKEGKRLFMPMQTANYLTALDRAGRPDLAMPYLEQLADFLLFAAHHRLHVSAPAPDAVLSRVSGKRVAHHAQAQVGR